MYLACPKKLEVVRLALTVVGAQNSLTLPIENYLRFQRVALFLFAVVVALLFFGLSIGVSVTSTMTNESMRPPYAVEAFMP